MVFPSAKELLEYWLVLLPQLEALVRHMEKNIE